MELMLIRQMHQRNVIFGIIGIFKIKDLNLSHKFAIVVTI